MRVLIVDDEKINRKVVVALLSRRGYEVLEASSGAQALNLCQCERFDFILMDIRMPEMNGFDAARQILQSSVANADVPIVALTAHATDSDRQRADQAGMKGFLRKPFSVDETLDLFNSIIARVTL
jgi:CheY-like chemotaxis protein